MIETRWPEYKALQADPYSVIGLKAFGRKTEVLVSMSVLVQLYGVGVVFMSLCAGLVHQLVQDHLNLTQVSSCDWIIIIGIASLPLMWLPSPSEISFIAYTAMSCTVISTVIIVVAFVQEGVKMTAPAPPTTVSFQTFCLSLGTIAFAYGGAATFPTFQNYMKDKTQFPYAVYAGFTSEYL
jgi:vesicular inhibitory amino acid transporter